MAKEQNVASDLYDFLVTKNLDPETSDVGGQDTQPNLSKVMTFDYVPQSGKNYGTAVLVISDDRELMLFFGDNLGKTMEEPDKTEWFNFLQELGHFAVSHNFYTFSPQNLSKLKHTMAGMAAIKEGLFEGYYGTRQVSYMGEPTQARLMIRHNRKLDELDARYRNVESLFIETADGERFRLPFVNLAGGRAMLEHVRQGGKPYDLRGTHIAEMVGDIKTLSRFRRANHGRIAEGTTQQVLEQANHHYAQLREHLRHLASARGYQKYFETWSPVNITETEALVEELKVMFTEQHIDSRIEQALPLLAKLQGTAMKEVEIFETWANRVSEGTWALPDTPEAQDSLEQLLAKELPVGPDATNVIEQIYDIFGDDELFDQLHDLADQDPDADARDIIRARAAELGIELANRSDQPAPDTTADTTADLTTTTEPGVQDTEQVEERLASGCNMTAEGEMCPEHGLTECGIGEGLMDQWEQHLAKSHGMKEQSQDPMDSRQAVTDSFYEDLARLKTLALSK
jgi:hypothetical protein